VINDMISIAFVGPRCRTPNAHFDIAIAWTFRAMSIKRGESDASKTDD
jgi:hypothetical protein